MLYLLFMTKLYALLRYQTLMTNYRVFLVVLKIKLEVYNVHILHTINHRSFSKASHWSTLKLLIGQQPHYFR